MLNPYEPTAVESQTDENAPSVVRAVLMGAIGYLAPLGILMAACWLRAGLSVAGDNFSRFANAHLSPSLNLLALVPPNVACMLFFALSGYRRPLADRWLSLGFATLFGYLTMVLVTMQWFPLPWTWSAITSNGLRSFIVITFPCLLFVIQNRRRRETPVD